MNKFLKRDITGRTIAGKVDPAAKPFGFGVNYYVANARKQFGPAQYHRDTPALRVLKWTAWLVVFCGLAFIVAAKVMVR